MHWVPFSTLHVREESDNNGSTDSVINKEAPAQQHLKDTERSPNLLGTCLGCLTSQTNYGDMGSIQQESHFKKIQNFKADYADATFTQYESQRTGLRVVVVDRKGPKVYGNFAVATEIHDDSGSRRYISATLSPDRTDNVQRTRSNISASWAHKSIHSRVY
jgi:hypothetical protein